MKMKLFFGALTLAVSSGALAVDPAPPAPKKECCCKKGEDGKMACCKEHGEGDDKSGHQGHDMGNMDHK